MTVIEIKPYRNGWKVFEAPGVEPVFLEQDQALYAGDCERWLAATGELWPVTPAIL
jgi:hypothetical protein